MQKFRSTFLIIGFLCSLYVYSSNKTFAQDTLEVMYYNVLNYPGSTPARVDYFRTINQYIKADIIVVNEVITEAGAEMLLQSGLNVYGSNNFSRAAFTNGTDTDNMLFYNSNKLVLYSQDTIETALRLINEYVLFYKTDTYSPSNDTTFMSFYTAHLKSSTGVANEQKRLAEVLEFKDHIDGIPNARNIFFGGDFNFYDSDEPAYQSLINDGIYPLSDPLPAGNWHDNESYAIIHTQSPRKLQFGGGAYGGIDDRFDFILYSNDVVDGTNGLSYVPNSCYALGNDGNHFDISLLAEPINTSIPDSVAQAIYYMADHLPVLCKIEVQIPETHQDKYLNLKVYLEGAFNGTDMNIAPAIIFPENQPFDQFPWNYSGSESSTEYLQNNITDWVLVELRETAEGINMATNTTKIWEQACLLLNDGTIISAIDYNLPKIEVDINDEIYTIISHRNHLDIISTNPLTLTDSIYSYDFSISGDQVLGSTNSYKELSTNLWGMISGDANSDGAINQFDKSIWIDQVGTNGYLPSDFNMDTQIDNADKNEFWLINQNYFSTIPD